MKHITINSYEISETLPYCFSQSGAAAAAKQLYDLTIRFNDKANYK